MPRRSDDLLVSCSMSPEEVAALEVLCATGRYTSRANAIRSALWSLTDFMEIDVPDGVWDQRIEGPTRRVARHERQVESPDTVEQKLRTPARRSSRSNPGAKHPWRK